MKYKAKGKTPWLVKPGSLWLVLGWVTAWEHQRLATWKESLTPMEIGATTNGDEEGISGAQWQQAPMDGWYQE